MIKPFLGIAFGGGGVRGAAHVGVLQELHKAGITADIVSGVSAGSIVAAMYAMSLDPFKLEDKFREIWKTHDFQKSSKSIFLKQKKNQPVDFPSTRVAEMRMGSSSQQILENYG